MTPYELTEIAKQRGWIVTEHDGLLYTLAPPVILDAPIDAEIMKRSAEILLPPIKRAFLDQLSQIWGLYGEPKMFDAAAARLLGLAKVRPLGQAKYAVSHALALGVQVRINPADGDVVLVAEEGADRKAALAILYPLMSEIHVGLIRASSVYCETEMFLGALRHELERPRETAA